MTIIIKHYDNFKNANGFLVRDSCIFGRPRTALWLFGLDVYSCVEVDFVVGCVLLTI